ncbi:uncharacterized protein TNIN_112521 [Trichonephila inaurata madagascariensis]|uniref:BTB domain-containing protein n=1 Tax=Trichonephila inaurata madagascariensis TaxID=2747483 RepID=A0A8X6XGE6_9ARAC|nr:uncharacterized protein TNIN_112521 [Trichonephila inaurata madagascariensis]
MLATRNTSSTVERRMEAAAVAQNAQCFEKVLTRRFARCRAEREETSAVNHGISAQEQKRCTSFQNVKRGEICKVPGSTVSPAPPGTPTPIRLPHAKPDVFREVLFYLYTGKVILQDCTVFESLSIAQELGIDELRMCCEDHINSTLNVHNACTFLPACLELENRIPGIYGNQ